MSVEVEILYEGDLHCQATHGPSKQTLRTDAPVDNGGKGEFFSPTDLVAAALGTCVMTILGLVARNYKLDFTGASVHVVKEMTATPVRRIGALMVVVAIPNASRISEKDRASIERAARACPVAHSLHPDVQVHIEFAYRD